MREWQVHHRHLSSRPGALSGHAGHVLPAQFTVLPPNQDML